MDQPHEPRLAGVNVAAACPLAWRTLHDPERALRRAAPSFALPGRAALWLCGCVALGLLCEGAMGDWSGVYLANNLGAAPSLAAAGYGFFSAAMVAGRLGGDWFVGRFGQARAVRYGGLISALGVAGALLALSAGERRWLRPRRARPVECRADRLQRRGARLGSSPAAGVATAAIFGYGGLLLGPVLIGALATVFGLTLTASGCSSLAAARSR